MVLLLVATILMSYRGMISELKLNNNYIFDII